MKSVEYIEHTADIRMKVSADTRVGLLEAGLTGMANLMKADACEEKHPPDMRHPITIHSVDFGALLIDFLSEVLTLSHIYKVVFCELEIHQLTETILEAHVLGVSTVGFDEDIKAVTYHEAKIRNDGHQGWEAVVVLDV